MDSTSEHDALLEEPNTGVVSVRGLYVSHFLSTWNARTFEFAACEISLVFPPLLTNATPQILFTAAVFPTTLLPVSIRGIAQTISLLLLSDPLGRYISKKPSRLLALRQTISVQRGCVAIACTGYLILLTLGKDWPAHIRMALFGVVVLSGVGERLASQANTMVMERDWIPTLAASNAGLDLATLNSRMRRIDLFCKLIAPVGFTLFQTCTAGQNSMAPTVGLILGTNILSPLVELVCVQRVYLEHPCLRVNREALISTLEEGQLKDGPKVSSFRLFMTSGICLPTIALALLYVSTLCLAGPMLTYLLAVGYTSFMLAMIQSSTAVFELSATVVAPLIIGKIGLERSGLWGIWLETSCLIPVTFILANYMNPSTPTSTIFLFSLIALSRLGLWTYDLVYAQIAQTNIPTARLARFTGVEQSLIAFASLALYITVGVWSAVEDFKKTAAASAACVLGAAALMAEWSRGRRGHLMHWEKIYPGCDDKSIPLDDDMM